MYISLLFRTLFKSSLLRYLRYYEVSAVHQFISVVEAVDMSGINVAFVSSGNTRLSLVNIPHNTLSSFVYFLNTLYAQFPGVTRTAQCVSGVTGLWPSC